MNSIIFTLLAKQYQGELNRKAERIAEHRDAHANYIPAALDQERYGKMIQAGEAVWGQRVDHAPSSPCICAECCFA